MEETFDIELIGKAFLLNALQDQAELLRQLQNPFRDSQAVRDLVGEVLESALVVKSTPVQIIGLGLLYGMATGIFIERERAARRGHSLDVDPVVREFLNGRYTQKTAIVRTFTEAFRDSLTVKKLEIAISDEVMRQRNSPIQAIAISMRYGMVIGMCLEKDRVVRERLAQEKRPLQ